jgi:hypothetical protein
VSKHLIAAREYADSHKGEQVEFDGADRIAYRRNDSNNRYYKVRWFPLPLMSNASGTQYFTKAVGGKATHGEFPLIVVREYYREKGYTVWASEPRLFNPITGEAEGYAAMSYPGARKPTNKNHHAYLRMYAIFGDKLAKLNEAADKAKRELKRNRAGGDPDLFVFKKGEEDKAFFVEVKDEDELTPNELTCFPLIEKYLDCDVKVVRIVARSKAQHATAK